MLAQQMSKSRQPVRRALKCASQFEGRERRLHIETAGEDECRDRALRGIRLVFDFDQSSDCCQRILRVHALPFRDFGRGSYPRGGSLGAGDRCGAKPAERLD